MAASTDWEEEFVEKMQEKRKRFGLSWEPSSAQENKLRQICGQAWLEDGYDR